MTRALVLFAHPCADSFSAALKDRVVATLSDRGWAVDLCDLYAEGFDPVLSPAERRGYHDSPENRAPVQGYVDRIIAAQAMVLVFPVWNFGYPAILKGFLDRVFLPGVSFRLERGQVRPNLTHIRKLAAVTTYGGNRMTAILMGDPPRRCVTRAMRHICRPDTMKYLALYNMNRASDATRSGFLTKVENKMKRF
ncbi:NAD(P)H-dependent oxidoreductase [Oceaniglobus ichthyenteri]|uniref:NAD(P)H-dependent oxidoreductase n=1 Tax=Oceaniglobus ichthyenteri TaxID=2136177 RepID=UPI000D379863|nr:NAD(P)H-dependent oxidoreductase [Oceaniglobus ichthyenteri]